MSMINNKWFQAGIVLIISNFFTPLGDSAVGAVGFLGMLFVFVPKLREIAKLDNLIKINIHTHAIDRLLLLEILQ